MKILMMMAFALVMAAGGGAGAYFYFQNQAVASAPAGKEKVEKKEKSDEKGIGFGYEYVELDPLVLPIVDKSGVTQTVSMVIALEVKAGKGPAIKGMAPKLKDAYIQDMYGMLNEHAALKGGVIQVDQIKTRLRELSQDVVEEGYVNDVLLQVVQQRPV